MRFRAGAAFLPYSLWIVLGIDAHLETQKGPVLAAFLTFVS